MANHNDSHSHENGHDTGHSHHYILPDSLALKVGATLLVLTAITVGLSYVHLGPFNFIVGMIVATIKGSLVAMIFMNLRKDSDRSNPLIFATSFIFLAIFIGLTSTDLFFRGDVYVTGPLYKDSPGGAPVLKKPWEFRPEIVAHGKTIFETQCVTCHGATGHGDGAGAASLNPKPRNFTQADGWKNGRKPSQIFHTLSTGLNAMPNFSNIKAEDRWALAQFVTSLGPDQLKDTPDELKTAGIDTTKEFVGTVEKKTVDASFAIDRIAKESGATNDDNVKSGVVGLDTYNARLRAGTFSK